MCALEFFGPDRVLFASDSPIDPEKGPGYIRDTIKVLKSLDLDSKAGAKINHRNAERPFWRVPGLRRASSPAAGQSDRRRLMRSGESGGCG